MERKGWEITIVQNDEWYEAKCTSSSGQTITSSIYETEDEAIEAGCLLVDRDWEKDHGIKRQVLDLDVSNVVESQLYRYGYDGIVWYIDLITGNTLQVLPEEFDEQPEIDSEYLEFSDRYLSIPDFSEPGQDMEEFIDSIEDEIKQAIVAEAFYKGGRGRFRRVRDIVDWEWSEFEYERNKERFLRWLESKNLELKSEETTETTSDDIKQKEDPDVFQDREFDPDKIKTARKKIQTSITRRQGQAKFRQELLAIYEGRCAISGCNVVESLEAAHIVPYAGEQTNYVANGLLLRADLHTLFDLNLITIDPDNKTVLIAPSLQGTYCEKFAGKKIYIPDLEFLLSKKALKHHYQQCEWVNHVIPSQCIAVVLEYVDTDVFKYHTALFQPMRLEGYDSIYWWTEEFIGKKYIDFDSATEQAIKFSQKQDIPLLWGVAHLVKAGSGTCAKIEKPPAVAKYGLKIGYGVYPVDEEGNKLEFRSAATLKKEQGLTAEQIGELGDPDRISKNPYYKNGSPMQLYLLERVNRQFYE